MRGWNISIARNALLTVLLLSALTACASFPRLGPKPTPPRLPDVSQAPATPDETVNTQPPPSTAAVDRKEENRLVYYRGVTGSLAASGISDDLLEGRTLDLSFNNAPVGDVARAVLAESLELPLTIADGVSGAVTLTSREPLPARDALAALETVLAESGFALIRTDVGFLLTTIENARERSQTLRSAGSGYVGYGVTIAPVKNASPSALAGLIDPFISNRVTVTADDERGALILEGSQAEVKAALDAIRSFDTPYLTDRVFGMFKLRYADAETLRAEIEALSDAAGDARAELIALPRLNLLFVTARTNETFRETRGWIERLDQPSGGDERRLRYYAVQNTPAEVLAAQLNAAFGNATFGGGGFQQESSRTESERGGSAVQPTFQQRAPTPRTPFSGDGNRATISTDEINNALIIRATDQEYREILELIEHMDVQSPQVLIEATIAEVTLTDELNYGVRWFFENAESKVSFPQGGPTGSDPPTSNVFSPIVPGLNYSYFDSNVNVALDTLASVTDVTVLSAPSIMVLNNQSANLQVGDEVPIVTQTAQSITDDNAPIVSSVQLRETGVILEVRPRINASDVVVLEITQEVSDVAETTTSGIDSPTIQQRRFTSTVAVKNNGTVALGGLIRETFTDSETGIPVLKDIPGLGYAFKSRDINKRRTELIIFLTPRIVRTDEDAQNAIRYIRRQMIELGKEDKLTQ